MKKFTDLAYVRPDFAAAEKQLREIGKKMKKAGSYEEFRECYRAAEEIMMDVSTRGSIAHIRNTMDKTDAYYEEEQKVLSAGNAKLALALQKVLREGLASPFRKDFDGEFGPQLLKDAETQLRLISAKVVPDMIREDKLRQEYSREVALCSCRFRGETCNFYGLLKHMESTDRQERREAFRAWAALYESVSPKLDRIYDRLVKLRVGKAGKLGFDSYLSLIHI